MDDPIKPELLHGDGGIVLPKSESSAANSSVNRCCKQLTTAISENLIEEKPHGFYLFDYQNVSDGEDAFGNEVFDEMPIASAKFKFCPFCGVELK